MLRRCLLLVLVSVVPAASHAQFSTFIPPKAKVPDSVAEVVAAAQKAKADSATARRIANMKTWVDSAAGLPPRPSFRSDTVLSPLDTAPPPVLVATARHASKPASQPASQPARSSPPPPLTRKGTRAPATASDLPSMILAGALSIVLGVVLIAGTPRVRHHA